MNGRRTSAPPPPIEANPPPPCGAGAGGGGRANAPTPDASARPPSADFVGASPARGEAVRARKLGHGWAPAPGEERQKERTRTRMRAKRLRRELTSSEKELRRLLRALPDAHFRTQVAIGDCVFDFGSFGARLLIELDGGIHELPEVQEWDTLKEAHAKRAGFRVLRFTNAEVWGRPEWVMGQVRSSPHPPTPAPQGGGGES